MTDKEERFNDFMFFIVNVDWKVLICWIAGHKPENEELGVTGTACPPATIKYTVCSRCNEVL